ncbi:MAG: rhomboid family intramembrane serine protease [Chloroflexota bacterium]
MTDRLGLDLEATLAHDGPLPRDVALAALDRAAQLMTSADFVDAARLYQRVIGFDDPAVTAAALLGLGEAWHRLDEDDRALATWEEATRLPDTPSTYPAWRNVAAARVRAGDLRGAMAAYREADRRAPSADRPEIASRLGWLSKELGDSGAAGKYFARARGDAGASITIGLVAITTIASLVVDFAGSEGAQLGNLLALDKVAVAQGEIWRLWTVTLVHAPLDVMPFHLLFNMYALWLAGPFVEQLYGRWRFLAFYLVFAAGGSLLTFAFGDSPGGVGASGAIFGLFGLLFAAQRIHHPVLDRQSRAFLGQLGGLLAINLLFGFIVSGIDNFAHIGGLIAGLWLGFLVAPTNVPTLRSMWFRPGPVAGTTVPAFGAGGTVVIRLAGIIALLGLFAALFAIGVGAWS